jgi:hypothetical protein
MMSYVSRPPREAELPLLANMEFEPNGPKRTAGQNLAREMLEAREALIFWSKSTSWPMYNKSIHFNVS